MMSNSNNSSWSNPCSDYYLMDEKLHNALVIGRLPYKYKDKKFINLNRFGVYLVAFRVLSGNNPSLIYNYLFYPDIFTDLLLMFSIIRFRFADSWVYEEWGGIYTFIDESLGYDKEGIIKDLINTPNNFNEYLKLEFENPESKINKSNKDSNFINILNKFVYIMDLNKMFYLLRLIYIKDNINFTQYLLKEFMNINISLSNLNMLDTNILNNSIFIVRDLNKFLNIIKTDPSFNLNQGNQKWRGQINSLNSFINSFDQDFRNSLYSYNQYHISVDTISPAYNLPRNLFSFNNIHKNLGNSFI